MITGISKIWHALADILLQASAPRSSRLLPANQLQARLDILHQTTTQLKRSRPPLPSQGWPWPPPDMSPQEFAQLVKQKQAYDQEHGYLSWPSSWHHSN